MVGSRLELVQAGSSPKHTAQPSNHVIILALSNDKLSKMKNGSFSRVNLLKTPLWSVLPLKAILISMVPCPKLYRNMRFMWMSMI